MNCPHHHRIFAAEPRSYRDLPLRLAEYGTCYRYEQSGELFGLMRVRSLQMNDAHIYCTEEQFADEFSAVNEMYLKYFKIFGLEKYQMRFSTHAPEGLGKKFVDEPELWMKTEDMVRDVLMRVGHQLRRSAQRSRVLRPEDRRAGLERHRPRIHPRHQPGGLRRARRASASPTATATTPSKTPLCIHRAPLGTHERFIGFLIEHYAGNFPLWLAPEQVRVLTIGDDEALVDYAKAHRAANCAPTWSAPRCDFSNDPIKAKIAAPSKRKVHTMLVIGGRDLEAGAVSVRIHGKGQQGAKPRAEVVAEILAAIRERRP